MKPILALLLAFIFVSCLPQGKTRKSESLKVMVKGESPINGSSNTIETFYSLAEGACQVTWQALAQKTEGGLTVQLRDRSQCTKPFADSTRLHKQVIERLLQDYPQTSIRDIVTGGLRSLQPDGSWNNVIGTAANASQEYQDYRRAYPDHESQNSVNKIFLDLVIQTQAHTPFKDLLTSFGLQFELDHAEKILNVKNSDGSTTIKDAGSLWWKPLF